MKIEINKREYEFELQGTVGLVYLCQKMMGEEPDFNKPYDQAVLYYCALTTSNPGVKDMPDLMQFMASLTTPLLTEMSSYFWKRWQELEGNASTKKDEGEAKGEESAPGSSTN